MKMPGKRKDKDDPCKSSSKSETLQHDQEQFLQAFEKPTQIYRYLRTRNMISPIFLHRSLTYMKSRMSRAHKNRTTFKIDEMLKNKVSRLGLNSSLSSDKSPRFLGNFLTLVFMEFADSNFLYQKSFVQVETFLLRVLHKKRKDGYADVRTEILGTTVVQTNKSDVNSVECQNYSILNLPKDLFQAVGCGSGGETPINSSPNSSSGIQSFLLLFKVHTSTSKDRYDYDYDDNYDPTVSYRKRFKYEAKSYCSEELTIFDKNGQCQLTDGEYILSVHEIDGQNVRKIGQRSSAKWETIPEGSFNASSVVDMQCNPLDEFEKLPSLKFRLHWLDEAKKIVGENDMKLNNSSSATVTSPNTRTVDPEPPVNTKFPINDDQRCEIVYQFIHNNTSCQQTESSRDYFCPWCSLNCINLYALLKHLKLCHDRFKFVYVPPSAHQSAISNQFGLINVTLNDLHDGSYNGSPYDNLLGFGYARGRGTPIRRTTVVTYLLVFKPRRGKSTLDEFYDTDDSELNSRPFLIGHNRLYHHTMTYMPIHPNEFDVDSEAENDPGWLKRKTITMIDEFTDVNQGEKEIMKMWNLHVMKYAFVGDCQIPIACELFVEQNGREILEKNLYRNFLLHLNMLFDYGLLSSEQLYTVVQGLQTILSENPQGKEVLTQSCNDQVEWWLTEGMYKPPMILSDTTLGFYKRPPRNN